MRPPKHGAAVMAIFCLCALLPSSHKDIFSCVIRSFFVLEVGPPPLFFFFSFYTNFMAELMGWVIPFSLLLRPRLYKSFILYISRIGSHFPSGGGGRGGHTIPFMGKKWLISLPLPSYGGLYRNLNGPKFTPDDWIVGSERNGIRLIHGLFILKKKNNNHLLNELK